MYIKKLTFFLKKKGLVSVFMAEKVGVEPTHRLTGLMHFECILLDHLSTSPYMSTPVSRSQTLIQFC